MTTVHKYKLLYLTWNVDLKVFLHKPEYFFYFKILYVNVANCLGNKMNGNWQAIKNGQLYFMCRPNLHLVNLLILWTAGKVQLVKIDFGVYNYINCVDIF